MLSIGSVLAYAASDASDNGSVDVLSVANSMNNDAASLQVANKSNDISKNTYSQPKLQAAEKGESAFSTLWLFVVALFWFVILSNRRGVWIVGYAWLIKFQLVLVQMALARIYNNENE